MPDMLPVVTTEVAFASNPTSTTPVWTDLAAVDGVSPVLSFSVDRGRDDEDSEPKVGTLSAVLDNSDGRFTPERTGSPCYPNVVTDRRCRVRATWNGTTYPLFDGYVERWPTSTDAHEYGEAGLVVTDALEALNAVDLPGPFDTMLMDKGPMAYFPMSERRGEAVGDKVSNKVLKFFAAENNTKNRTGSYSLAGPALVPSEDTTSLEFAPYIDGTDRGAWRASFSGSGLGYVATNGFTVAIMVHPTGSLPLPEEQTFLDIGNLEVQYGTAGSYVIRGAGLLIQTSPPYTSSGKVEPPYLLIIRIDPDKRTLGFSFNGSTFTTFVATSDIIPTLGTVTIGAPASGTGSGTGGFQGYLSHLALYNYEFTSADADDLEAARTGHVGEMPGTRIARLLDAADWPTGASYRQLDTGSFALGYQPQDSETGHSATSRAAATEGGLLFADAAGAVVFHDRNHRTDAVVKGVLGTDGTDLQDTVEFSYDRSGIRNDITVRSSSATVWVSNATSIAKHRRRTATFDADLNDDADVRTLANYLLARDAYPRTRIGQVTLNPVSNPDLWPFVLSAEIGDHVILTNLPPRAPRPTMGAFVEGIKHDVSQTSWRTTLSLTLTTSNSTWLVGSARVGVDTVA